LLLVDNQLGLASATLMLRANGDGLIIPELATLTGTVVNPTITEAMNTALSSCLTVSGMTMSARPKEKLFAAASSE
jgi:hypothetical protein